MVQLSPDTRLEGWDGCSGYHYDDDVVYGFSHTHLSGTGCSDYGDILLMPGVGDAAFNNGADGKPGYRQHFSHADETASPGYYSVVLADSGVKVELTATTRVGVHRYAFPAGTTTARVVIDLAHRDKVLASSLQVVGDREVRGYRRSRAWAEDQHTYFAARFSRPIAGHTFIGGAELASAPVVAGQDGVKASLTFDVSDGAPLVIAVGISGTDEDGAARNLAAEMPNLDFDAARSAAQASWRSQLSKIEVRGGTPAQRRTFYSALYHCCIAPNVWGDVDGRYRGRDGQVHKADGWTQYTVFSLWDTFRALHPLMTILEPDRTNDWINTFLAQYREGGALPVWELAANETDCMIGYHAVPVIADAYAKGIRGYDANAALDAMVASANRDVRGLPAYREQGFVPSEVEGESVSKTLEYAYDDWCIAEMARALGRIDVAAEFEVRAQSWKNLFDSSTGFFRPRRNQAWVQPFDPTEVNFHLTEANSWQYSMFVPHDVAALTSMLGPNHPLARRLDQLFAAPSATTGRDQADITGLIGQYAHGYEPSHHMAYLYAFDGEPWKTQERVRQIVDTLYADRPDGLCGNEDCGQMSAWYVLSALGFYPVCPGKPEYAIGSPLFPSAVIHLDDADDARTCVIRTSGDGPYIQSATLNGAPLLGTVLDHAAITAGGTLEFTLGPTPSRWGGDGAPRPQTSQRGTPIVPVPILDRSERTFREAMTVSPRSIVPDAVGARFYVSTDGGRSFAPWEGPLRLTETTDLVFFQAAGGDSENGRESRRARARFVRLPHDRTIRIAHPYAPQYAANGDVTLIDGLRGGTDFRTGDWQGYQGADLDVTIDLGAEHEIKQIRAGFLQDMGSWIWMPEQVDVFVRGDAESATWALLGDVIHNDVDEHAGGGIVKRFTTTIHGERARFVRVVGKNRGVCPPWHPGAGHMAWLFADEIEIDVAE